MGTKRSEYQKIAALQMVSMVNEFRDNCGDDLNGYRANVVFRDVVDFINAQSSLLEVLLKHNEPVSPVMDDVAHCYVCGDCGEVVSIVHHYCSSCGRMIDWDD